MALKYYKSDFALMVELNARMTNENGEQIKLDTSYPFEFRFFTDNTNAVHFDVDARETYSATWDGVSAVKNCKVIDPTHVMVYFDHTLFKFGIGRLLVEINIMIPDPHYEGDVIQNIKRLYTTGYVLTDNADEDTDEDVTLRVEYAQMVLSATAKWYEDRVEAAIAAAGKAERTAYDAAARQPIVKNGTWWTWDVATLQYKDTGESVNSNYTLTQDKVLNVVPGLTIAGEDVDDTDYPDLF